MINLFISKKTEERNEEMSLCASVEFFSSARPAVVQHLCGCFYLKANGDSDGEWEFE